MSARRGRPRDGFILPVVLVLIGLLALTMAGFVFFVHSETNGTIALREGQQARLAAESGFEEVVSILRKSPHDASVWFDNPQKFRSALVWGDGFDRESDPVRKDGSRMGILEGKEPARVAWRYSVVAPVFDSRIQRAMRFGLTPESGKLNINTATDAQLTQLLTPLLQAMGVENAGELVAALLDWRDQDSDVRDGGAENDYYNTLTPAYNAKNGPVDSIEELLLIKGFSGAVLWGEDTNRNGILDPNEDDADASFPAYDNADNVLNYGIAPFLTIWSAEPDTALDNKQRINLNGNAAAITAAIAAQIKEDELSPETIAYIAQLKGSNFNFAQLGSPAELYRGKPGEIKLPSNDENDAGGDAQIPPGGGSPNPSPSGSGGKKDEQAAPPGDGGKDDGNPPADNPGDEQNDPKGDTGGKKPGRFQQKDDGNPPEPGQQDIPGLPGAPGTAQPDGTAGGAGALAMVLQDSPVTLQDLPVLMDRFSTRAAQGQNGMIPGLINVNTAPARVLALIPGMPPDAPQKIVDARSQVDAISLRTPAWLLTAGLVDTPTFHAIAPYITTKAYQFEVEVVSYADHIRLSRRYEWVIEMIGPLAQVRYFRDLTSLGLAWPVDDDTIVSTRK